MADTADLDDWARRYLDLWEDQVAVLASDHDFAKLLLAQISAFGSLSALAAARETSPLDPAALPEAMAAWREVVAAAMARAAEAQSKGGGAKGDGGKSGNDGEGLTSGDAAKGGGSTGAAPAAAASEPQHPDLDVLARRLADLEARVASLEAGSEKGAAGGTASSPRRRGRKSAP